MKKILTLTLVCLIMVSSTVFADKVTETTSKTPSNMPPYSIDYRSYTGFKVNGKEGKITLQAYHTKMDNKDMFLYYVQYCVNNDRIGTCSYFYSNGWTEGKVAGQNWIIKDSNFNANLGKKIGHIKTDSLQAKLEIE
jgi:hypothetical protein